MIRDLRYALRLLASRPGFTAVAVLTLALGIGANTAIFTVVNAVLLRPFSFQDPDRLMLLVERTTKFPTITTSWLNFGDWRDQSRSFDAVAAYRNLTVTIAGGAEPERLPAKNVTARLLPMLGVSPALGRPFSDADDRAGAPGVALITDALWRRRFGADVNVLGRAITLDDQPYTIVGVLPASFQLMLPADILLPMGPWAATLPDDRSWHPGIFAVGRLKAGTSGAQAQSEMNVISDRLSKQYPTFNTGVSADVVPLHEYAVQNVRRSLLLLVAAVAFVLLIACANVANLLLARSIGRQREIAIRTAVGASRAQIASQLMIESLVLAAAGGAAGILVAIWCLPLVSALGNAPGVAPIRLDPAALAYTVALSLATGIVFGFAPAMQTTRSGMTSAINDGGRGAGAGRSHRRLRGLLVIAEIGLAMMLLVSAGLLTRSLLRLQDVSPGFDPEHVLLGDMPMSAASYGKNDARNVFVDQLLAGLRSKPGVQLAELATAPPFSGAGSSLHFNIIGRPPKGPDEFVITGYRAISSGYFSALKVPLRAGRVFTDRDRDASPPVSVVNETFVRRFFNGSRDEALRAHIQIGGEPNDETPRMQIVGIVGDTKQALEAEPQPIAYVPYLQPTISLLGGMYRNPTIVLRSDRDAAAQASTLRAAVHGLNPDQPLARVTTMENAMADSVSLPRLRTTLLALLSGLALTLSLIGVYGVMAYSVSERTHEIGVRIALGASERDIRALVVGSGVRLAAAGVAIGVLGAIVAARGLQALLFGIDALDPATFAAAAIGLSCAAVAAAYAPARRASRIDPVGLLR